MSEIHIVRRHNGDPEHARQAAEKAAEHMAERHDIEYHWEDDAIHFSRLGVHGTMRIDPENIEIHAHLGFLLAMLKGTIEEEIRKELDQHFA
ncbi:MAG: polyhydroxyalkanoic acid system family protein [Xanthomonadales bacterium]|nr:polyhydroxyalkanoic acid system family protein [Xanthomonadales bacterium]